MSLSRTNAWIAGTVAVCVLLSAAAWFLLIAPTRANAAELRETTESTAASNDQLQIKVNQLAAQNETLDEKRAELAVVREAMPADPDLALLNRKLEAEAAAAGVTLMRVAPGAAVPVVAPTPVAVAPVEGESADAAAAATPAPTPASSVLAIPVSLDVIGPFANVSSFLQAVQTKLGRDFLVQSLNVVAEDPAEASGAKPATANGDVTMTITGSVFVLPETAAAAAAPTAPDAGTGSTDS